MANKKGVTIPSQRRFINYYEKVLKEGLPAKHVAALLKNIVVENISNFDDIRSLFSSFFIIYIIYIIIFIHLNNKINI